MEKRKRVAIITGATGGIGREFVQVLMDEELDEIWAVGRNEVTVIPNGFSSMFRARE